MQPRFLLRMVAVLLALVAGPCRSADASTFDIELSNFVQLSQFTPWSNGLFDNNDLLVSAGHAGATDGSLSMAYGNSFNFASATSNIRDIVFSGPGPTVQVSGNLLFDVDFSRYFEGWSGNGVTDDSFTGSQLGIQFGGDFGSGSFQFAFGSNQDLPTITNPDNDPYTFTQLSREVNLLSSVIGGQPWVGAGFSETYFLTGEMSFQQTVPTGIPLFMQLNMFTATSSLSGTVIAEAAGETDGLNTFGFPTGNAVVFDLPAGYTANASSIGLVDNSIPSSEVPEPGSASLLSGGCAAFVVLALARRRRLQSTKL